MQEVAQAADFVRAMSDGLDSVIAQGGASVSGFGIPFIFVMYSGYCVAGPPVRASNA